MGSITAIVRHIDEIDVHENEDDEEKLLQLQNELESALFAECPVKTGFMRSQITVTYTKGYFDVDIPVDYASFVVEGTWKQEANDFIEKAVAKVPGLVLDSIS